MDFAFVIFGRESVTPSFCGLGTTEPPCRGFFCRLKTMPRRSPELIRAQARLRAARLLVQEFRPRIAQLAREGKSTADAKISLEICESALAELSEREAPHS